MLLKIVVFICGAVIMSLEMVGARVLDYSFTGGLPAWGALIGTFIGALSLGYWLGGLAADRWPTRLAVAGIISAAGILATLLVPLTEPVGDWIRQMQIARPEHEMWLKPLVASAVLYGLPVALLGAVSPYCVKLASRDLERLGRRVGGFYAISSVGSIFGTFFTAFYLIATVRMSHIVLAEGLLLMALSIPVYLAGFFFENPGAVPPAPVPQRPAENADPQGPRGAA
jgi:hypothetical protein